MYALSLQELSLAGNMLTKLPDSLGNLTHLQKLQISGNRLTHLPASIGNLNRLEVCLCMIAPAFSRRRAKYGAKHTSTFTECCCAESSWKPPPS